MGGSSKEILDKNTKIELLSRLPDESPHPVLRISKQGQLLYLNPASLPLLRLANFGPAETLLLEWQRLAHETFDQSTIKTIELAFSERFFLSPFLLLRKTTM